MAQAQLARLVLADGSVFEGVGFGASKITSGEVVFNTSMTGYQEILTDPSYAGQIVVMTYPHIGNYGVNPTDTESKKISATGFVVREDSRVVSNFRAKSSLQKELGRQGVSGIANIDTRSLVRHLREQGAMPAVIAVGSRWKVADLKRRAKKLPTMDGQNLAEMVSTVRQYEWTTASLGRRTKDEGRIKNRRCKVIAYDFGIKINILRLLDASGCDVTVVPYGTPAEKILAMKKVDGVFLSNGPGDPAACDEAIQNVKALLGKKPIFGICLGHQILALALGAKTYKLKFGHRGGNQPVKNLRKQTVEITAQNHGFAVDPKSLPKDVEVTHLHLNDQTVSGIRHKTLPAFSVQYHPEASPGPHDSQYLFEEFIELMT